MGKIEKCVYCGRLVSSFRIIGLPLGKYNSKFGFICYECYYKRQNRLEKKEKIQIYYNKNQGCFVSGKVSRVDK